MTSIYIYFKIGMPTAVLDNWLVLNANKRRHTTIDATRTLLALHQTTKKGNGEGRSHPNAHYNGNILRKLYNKINYFKRMQRAKYHRIHRCTPQQQNLKLHRPFFWFKQLLDQKIMSATFSFH
jgi:hypothetical protein